MANTFPVRNCERQDELISFIKKERRGAKSSWYHDRYFRRRTTTAERIEARRYIKDPARPVLYTGACEPPHKLIRPKESLQRMDWSFPTLKVGTQIGPCDVDEHRIRADGTRVPVGQRIDEAIFEGMMDLFDSIKATWNSEAIQILKYGSYPIRVGLNGPSDVMGTVDFKKSAPDSDAFDEGPFKWDFSEGTGQFGAWSDPCAKPFKQLEIVLQHMRKCMALTGGVIDWVHSPLSWSWMEGHSEATGIKYQMNPPLGNDFEQALFSEYDSVTFRGRTVHGNVVVNHWVDASEYWEFNPEINDFELIPVLNPGESLVVSDGGLDGQHLFRTIDPMEMNRLPDGTNNPWFEYTDPMYRSVFKEEAECYTPWVKMYPLMIPRNVDAAQLMCVVPPGTEPCTVCQKCPDTPAAEGKDTP